MRIALLGLSIVALAAQPQPDPAFGPVQDDPAVPRVLLIGDSISIGYTLPVRELLKGKANLHRIPENGGPTTTGLARLDAWLAGGRWDVIHFNWGLHDLKLDERGARQVPVEQYESNLRELVKRLKATGARLIWASTTPVPAGKLSPPRRPADVPIYNAAAKRVMDGNGIAIDDLYRFALPRASQIQRPANVHFTPEGSAALAGQVAAAIERTLGKAPGPRTLFNGKDLTNFYTYLRESKYEDPRKVFTVRDRMLRISGEEWGGLTTRESFRDYRLVVEWRWGKLTFPPRTDRARDSGILVHGAGEDGAAGRCWLESIESQIIEGGCGDFILVAGQGRPSLTAETRTDAKGELYWEKGGPPVTRDRGRFNWFGRDPEWRDALGFRGRRDVERPAGEWNRQEVVCDGDSLTNILNGVVVNHATRSSHTQGKIQIQSEGAEIFFRRIELRPVAGTGVTKPG